MLRFDVALGLRRSRQLQQTVADAIEAACRVMIIGATNVTVSQIDVQLFQVTVTLNMTSSVSLTDLIGIVQETDFPVVLSSILERPVNLVGSSIEIYVEGMWIRVSGPSLPPSLPSPASFAC